MREEEKRRCWSTRRQISNPLWSSSVFLLCINHRRHYSSSLSSASSSSSIRFLLFLRLLLLFFILVLISSFYLYIFVFVSRLFISFVWILFLTFHLPFLQISHIYIFCSSSTCSSPYFVPLAFPLPSLTSGTKASGGGFPTWDFPLYLLSIGSRLFVIFLCLCNCLFVI